MTARRAAVAAFVVLAVFASAAPTVLANGAGREIFRGVEGPFQLVVRVQPEEPALGAVHLTFEPTIASTGEPADDAMIEVLAKDAEGAERYHVRAVNTPLERQYYDANITFHEAGEWTLVVDVEQAGTGAATFEVPMTVAPQLIPARAVAGTLVFLLISGAIVGGVVLLWYQSRRALTAPRAGGRLAAGSSLLVQKTRPRTMNPATQLISTVGPKAISQPSRPCRAGPLSHR